MIVTSPIFFVYKGRGSRRKAVYTSACWRCRAGVNPASARGSRTGVFIGCSSSESHDAWTALAAASDSVRGYELTGCTRSMFANRLSYFFDFRGTYCGMNTISEHNN